MRNTKHNVSESTHLREQTRGNSVVGFGNGVRQCGLTFFSSQTNLYI